MNLNKTGSCGIKGPRFLASILRKRPRVGKYSYHQVVSSGEFPLGDKTMAAEWISRLKGHAELVQSLVRDVPKALDRPSLTFEQATRLHTVIEKGVRDFDEVLQLMDGSEVDETYRQAAESLARTWQHLSDAAEEKIRSLGDHNQTPLRDDENGVSFEFADNDETEQTDIDRKQ
jgi:hypothetical protein